MKNIFKLLVLSGCFYASFCWSQCGGGIPSAGNPGCIPPDRENSPYYQGDNNYTPSPRIIWEDRFGAVAYDKNTGKIGTSINHKNQSQAEEQALFDCKKNGGGENCKINMRYSNGCAVIIDGDDAIYFGGGGNTKEAESKPSNECQESSTPSSCKKIYEACSLPVRTR